MATNNYRCCETEVYFNECQTRSILIYSIYDHFIGVVVYYYF